MRRHASAGYGLAVRFILLAALLAALVVAPASGAQAERTATVAATKLKRATCPRDLSGCRSAIGRVVVGRDSVTAPGFTAVDVRRGLRPRRDPKVGQLVTAAGQVQRGSYGQRQIHAVSFRVG